MGLRGAGVRRLRGDAADHRGFRGNLDVDLQPADAVPELDLGPRQRSREARPPHPVRGFGFPLRYRDPSMIWGDRHVGFLRAAARFVDVLAAWNLPVVGAGADLAPCR